MSADFTSQDIIALRDSLTAMNQTMVKLAGTNNKAAASQRPSPAPTSNYNNGQVTADRESTKVTLMGTEAAKKLGAGISKVARDAEGLGTEFRQLNSGVRNLGALFSMSGALGTMFKGMGESIDTFRDLSSVGQTFGGSMLQMQIAAADARVPLEEFAAMVKKNSMVIATTGTTAYIAMGNTLKDSLSQFGMLNMTTEQLSSFMGDYMETQRTYGRLNKINALDTADSMSKLAIETTKMANLTGVERGKIMQNANAALQDNSIRTKMFMNAGEGVKSLTDNLNKATVYMSAMPDDAGAIMSRMLTQTVGRNGASMADDMRTFTDAGLYGITDLYDGIRRKIQSGQPILDSDMDTFRKNLVEMGTRNMGALKANADAGNESAVKVTNMITSLASVTDSQLADIKKSKDLNNFMMNLQSNVQSLSGLMRGSFYKTLFELSEKFGDITKSTGFESLRKKAEELGATFGTWITSVFTSANLQKLADGIVPFFEALVSATKFLFDFGSLIGGIIGTVTGLFGELANKVGTTAAAFGLLATYMAAKFAYVAIKEQMAGKHNIGGGNGSGGFGPGNFQNLALKVFVMNQPNSVSGAGLGSEGSNRPNPSSPESNKRPGKMERMGRTAGRSVGRVRGAMGSMGSAVGRVAGAAGRGIRGAANVVGGVRGAGLGGAVIGGAMGLMNSAGPFAGSGVANVLGGAASGAATGAMFGPMGAAIGGVIGGAISAFEHWDELTNDISQAYTYISDAAGQGLSWFTGTVSDVWNNSKNFAVGVGNSIAGLWNTGVASAASGYQEVVGAASSGLQQYAKSAGDTFQGIMNYDYQGMADKIGNAGSSIKDVISGIVSKIGGLIGDLFTWIGDFLTGNSMMAKLVGMSPMGAAVIAAVKGNRAEIKPQESQTAATVNTDAMQSQILALQQQQQQILRENMELKTKLDTLIAGLADSSNLQTVGMIEMIALTKKNNKELVVANRE